MKKHVVLTAMLVVCLFNLQAQSENRISTTLAAKFASDFPHAIDSRWTEASGVSLAFFRSDGEVYIAYYNASERQIATARKIGAPTLLPLLVRNALDESCKTLGNNTKMGPIFELVIGNSTRYVVSVEGRKHVCTFRFDPMGNRTVMDRRPTRQPGAAGSTPLIAREPRF